MCGHALRPSKRIFPHAPLPDFVSTVTARELRHIQMVTIRPAFGSAMTTRIGVLGCGGIARAAHLSSLGRIAGAEVVALADADPGSLAAARALAPGARAVSDCNDVLEMSDVDAVIISLPPALHADAAIAALHHGKHVYIEKPLATSLADAERVAAASRGTALVSMMGFNYRRNPIVIQAREAIAAGSLGAPLAMRTVFSTPARAVPAWKQRRDTGGGVLLDLAVHHIDLTRFLLGAEIATVSAELQSIRTEQDTAFVQLGLTNRCTVQSFFSLSAIEEDRIEVYGYEAKLTIDRYRSLRLELVPAAVGGALGLAARRFAAEVAALPYALRKMRSPLHDPSFPASLEAFVHAVQARSMVRPDISDGLRAVAVIEAAELSARTGRMVSLDEAPSTSSTSSTLSGRPIMDVARA
jgi:predicted dehydrogenase